MVSFIAALGLAAAVVPNALAQSPSASAPAPSSPAPAPSSPAPAPSSPAAPSPPPADFTPLASKRFDYSALPYKADTSTGERGTQSGYNICNSTTAGPTSMCQTAIINSIEDFCIWGPPKPNSEIGSSEGEAVAWCTKPDYGTRVIPKGALTGVQFIKAPAYVQITGVVNQQLINIAPNDTGGEMDPHGADQRGNPLGGLLFSKAFSNTTFVQVVEWHNFMGGNRFCLKACDPSGPDAARYCEHVFDRIGCKYNAPAAYQDGAFLSCRGANQDFPGIYTGSNGQVTTYSQPPESLGAIATMPYEPKIPATSECITYTSAQIYASAPDASSTGSSATTKPPSTSSTARPSSANTQTSSTTGAAPRGVSAGAVGPLAAVLAASLLAGMAL